MPEITHLNQKIRNMNNLKEFKKEGNNFENCQMNKIDILFKEYVEKKELVDCSAWKFEKIKRKFNEYDQLNYKCQSIITPDYLAYIERNIFKDNYEIPDINDNLKLVIMKMIKLDAFIFRILEIVIMLFDEEKKEEIEELDRQQENHFNF